MKKLFLSALLCIVLRADAATINGYFTDGASNAISTVLVWRGVSVTYGIGTSNVVFQSRFNMPVTNGIPQNNTNVQGGLYFVFNPLQNVTVPVLVPTNNAAFQFGSLITNLPSFTIWNYINASNVVIAVGPNLFATVNPTNGPTWTIVFTNTPTFDASLLTNLTRAQIIAALGYTPATNSNAGAISALGYTPATNSNAGTLAALGYTPATNSYGAISNLLGFVPATNNNAGAIAALGYTPATNSVAGITAALTYSPATNSFAGLKSALGFQPMTNATILLNTNFTFLNGTTNPSTAYMTNGIIQRTSTP
jgi:hypothetical protein